MQLLGTRVLLQRVNKGESTTTSGIILTEDTKRTAEYEVIEASEGARSITVGMKVLVSEFLEQRVEIDGSEYFVVEEEDIIGIIE